MNDWEFSKIGIVFGFISWVVFCLIQVSYTSCIQAGNICGGWDLFLSMIIGVAMLAPATIVALITSIFI